MWYCLEVLEELRELIKKAKGIKETVWEDGGLWWKFCRRRRKEPGVFID
jgi:hypothetical protein